MNLPPAPWEGLLLERLTPAQRRIADAMYALGFMHGIDRGREQVFEEADARFAATTRHVRALAKVPPYDVLAERRGEHDRAERQREILRERGIAS